MYNPQRYLTMDILAEVLAEREWPTPYRLENHLPDGIATCAPSS